MSIATRNGLTVEQRDKYRIDEFNRAIQFKEKACRDYARSGISSVTKKYVDRA